MKRGKETKRDKPSFKSISTLSRIMDSSNDVGLSRSHHSEAFLRDLGTDDLDHTVESKEIPITTHAERRTTTRTKMADRHAGDKPSPSSHLVSSRLVSSRLVDIIGSPVELPSFPLRIVPTLVDSDSISLDTRRPCYHPSNVEIVINLNLDVDLGESRSNPALRPCFACFLSLAITTLIVSFDQTPGFIWSHSTSTSTSNWVSPRTEATRNSFVSFDLVSSRCRNRARSRQTSFIENPIPTQHSPIDGSPGNLDILDLIPL